MKLRLYLVSIDFRYILINGDDPTVLLASDKQYSNSKEHANSNDISKHPQGNTLFSFKTIMQRLKDN